MQPKYRYGNLVRYRNRPDKTPHQLRTTMHHNPLNQQRTINLYFDKK